MLINIFIFYLIIIIIFYFQKMIEVDIKKNINKNIIKPINFNTIPVDEFIENYKYNQNNEILKFFGIKNFNNIENDSDLIKKYIDNKDYKELIKFILKLDSYELEMISKNNKNLFQENDNSKLFYFIKRFISNSILLDCEELNEILNSIINDKKSKLIKSIRIIIQNLENSKLFYFYFYNQYKTNLNTLIDKSLHSPKDQSDLITDFLKTILITNRKHNKILDRKRNKLILNDIIDNSGEDFNLENRDLLKKWFIETSKDDFIYLHKKIEKEIDHLDELFNNFNKEDKYLIDSLIYYIENKALYYCLEINDGINKKDPFVIIRSLVNIYKEKIVDKVIIIYKQLYEKDLIEIFKDDEEYSFIINQLIN